MGWINWTRKAADSFGMSVASLGLDLNATRFRAMSGETGRPPGNALNAGHAALRRAWEPMALSLRKILPLAER